MRKPLALISALLVMLLSPVPLVAPPSFAPGPARAQGAADPVVTIRDAETESLLRGIAHPPLRAAGVDAGLVRITLIQARPINAFVTSGNRMFIHTGLIRQAAGLGERPERDSGTTRPQLATAPGRLGGMPLADEALPPGPPRLRAQDLRNAAQRDKLTRKQRRQDDAMRRRYPR